MSPNSFWNRMKHPKRVFVLKTPFSFCGKLFSKISILTNPGKSFRITFTPWPAVKPQHCIFLLATIDRFSYKSKYTPPLIHPHTHTTTTTKSMKHQICQYSKPSNYKYFGLGLIKKYQCFGIKCHFCRTVMIRSQIV